MIRVCEKHNGVVCYEARNSSSNEDCPMCEAEEQIEDLQNELKELEFQLEQKGDGK